MKIKLKPNKKVITLLLTLALAAGFGSATHAAVTFRNDLNGASSTEVLQVKYDGAAWNYDGSGYNWASFTYIRDGRTLLTKTTYNGKVTGSVWDDLLHWNKEYTTLFNWSRG